MINRLKKGHAYTITRVANIVTGNREICLIRLRNPWGNEYEWKGAWSDNSREWNSISESIKNELDFVKLNEGEFWMSFDDFLENYDSMQFCHLTPDSLSEEILKGANDNQITWKTIEYHGEWVSGYSAGGCGNGNNQLFWTNPQFLVKLDNHDQNNDDGLTTMIVALMQKYTREKRTHRRGNPGEEHIHFRLFKIIDPADIARAIQTKQKFTSNQLDRVGDSGSYVNKREVTQRFSLHSGHYLIIPSTFDPNISGEFLIRIFSEVPIDHRNTHILSEHGLNEIPADPFEDFKISRIASGWSSLLNSNQGFDNETRQFLKVNFAGNVASSGIEHFGLIAAWAQYQKIDVEPPKRVKKEACNIM